jgi:glycosyltransferase involved in cell wall biosynthesis/Flp pilus assembly protein TadD
MNTIEETISVRTEKGRIATQQKQWEKSLQIWITLASADQNNLEAFYRAGQAAFHLDDLVNAQSYLKTAVQINPNFTEAIRYLGRIYSRNKNWELAKLYWNKFSALDSEDFEGQFRLGQACVYLEEFNLALPLLELATRQRPSAIDTMEIYATALEGVGQFSEAIQVWQGYPHNSTGQKDRSLSRLLIKIGASTPAKSGNTNQSKLTKSDSNLISREALASNLSEVIFNGEVKKNDLDENLIHALDEANQSRQWHEVLKLSNQILLKDESYPQANFLKAKALFRLGRAYEAIVPIQKALLENQEDAQAQTLFSLIQRKTSQKYSATPTRDEDSSDRSISIEEARELSKKKLWSESLNAWELLVLEDPKIFEPHYRCAVSLFHLHRLEESDSYVRSGLLIRPDHIDSNILLARIAHNLEKWEDAKENWESVLILEPNFFESYYRLAQIASTQKKLIESKELYERAISIRPGHTDCISQYLGVLKKLSLQSEALALFDKLTKDRQQDIEVMLNRAVILAETQKSEYATNQLISSLNLQSATVREKCEVSRFFVKHARWNELIDLFSSFCDEKIQTPDDFFIELLDNLSIAYEKIGDADKSILIIDLIIEATPNHQNALVRKARLFRAQTKISEAVEIRRRLIDFYPNKVDHYSELIFLLGGLDRDNEIPAVLTLAHNHLNMTAAELFSIGRGLESAVLIKEAEKYYVDASKKDPVYLGRLAEFFYRNGQVKEALQSSISAHQFDPQNITNAKVLLNCLKLLELIEIKYDQVNSPQTSSDLISTPQILFKYLVDSLSAHPRSYEPNPNGVVLVTGSLAGGGAERQLVTTIRGLMKYVRGPENIALFAQDLSRSLKRDFYLPYIADLPLDIVRLDSEVANIILHHEIDFQDAQLINLFPSEMVTSIAFWYSEIQRRKPAVVHAWQDMTCLTAVVAALLAGTPRIILNTRSMRPDNPRRRLKLFMAQAYQSVLKHPSVLMLNNSRAGARDYEEWLNIPSGSIEVNHNGIDFESLAAKANQATTDRLRSELRIPKSALVIGGVFRFSEEKRPFLWIETAHLVALNNPNVHFVIAGDGPMYQKTREKAIELGISDRVHMPGHVEVAPWFLMMDILLLTSRMEGMPNVLLEAQSLGISVVAPNVGGCPETVDQGKTGWIVDNADANNLSERIIWMLNNPEWMRKAKKRAIQFAKTGFSIDAMIGRTIKVYQLPLMAELETDSINVDAQSDVTQLCSQANQLLAEQNPGAALEVLKKLELSSSQDPLMYRLLARAQSRLGRQHEALGYWKKLLGLLADDFEATYRSGELQVALEQDSQALVDLKKAIKINESHAGPWRAIARLYTRQGLLPMALESWNHLLLLEPSDAEALFSSGKILLQIRQNKKGEERLAYAASVGKSYQAAELLVKILSFSKRSDQALVVAKTGVAHNPRSLQWHQLLFNLYVTLGQESEIDAYLKNIHRENEQSTFDKLFYARLLIAAERFDEAKIVLLALISYLEVRVQAIIAIIQIGLQTANFAESEKYYLELSAEDLKNKSITDDIGKVQQAIEEYQLFTKQFSNELSLGNSSQTVTDLFLGNLKTKIAALPIKFEKNTVLHIVNSLAAGGTERQAVETAIAQKNSGLYKEVIVLRADPADSGRASFFIPRLEQAGVSTQTLSDFILNNEISDSPKIDLFDNPGGVIAGYLGLSEIRQYLRAIQYIKPQYLHLWTPQCCVRAGIAAIVSKVPKIILRAGSVSPGDRIGMMPGELTQFTFFQKAYKSLVEQKNVVLVNNCQANLESYANWMGVDLGAIRSGIIHNGIDFSRFGSVDSKQVEILREDFDIPKNAIVIGSVVRFEKEKGLDVWLDIARQLVEKNDNIHFVLVGEGRLRNSLIERIQAQDLEDNIHLPGMISEGIANYYGLMDLFILTSVYEGLPNALIEAQWFGIPVLSTQVGGVSEAISPGLTGQLIKSGDVDAYIAAIEALISDSKKLKKMGLAGMQFVKDHFSIEQMLAQTNKLYQA